MIGKILFNVFGPPAIKAIFGGLATAGTVAATTAASACDFTQFGSQIGSIIGAYVVGHAVTWLAPANRPKV